MQFTCFCVQITTALTAGYALYCAPRGDGSLAFLLTNTNIFFDSAVHHSGPAAPYSEEVVPFDCDRFKEYMWAPLDWTNPSASFMGTHKEKYGASCKIGTGAADLNQRRSNVKSSAAVRLLIEDVANIGAVDYGAIPANFLSESSIELTMQGVNARATTLWLADAAGSFDIGDLKKENARANWAKSSGETCLVCKLVLTGSRLL